MMDKKKALAKLVYYSIETARDAIAITGAAAITKGTHMIYEPAGYIVGGILLLSASIVGYRQLKKGKG